MKQRLFQILRYVNRFGLFNGLLNYFRIRLAKSGELALQVKGIPHTVYLRTNSSDLQAFDQVIAGAEYDYRFPIQPEFILDCGANIGLATLFFRSKFPAAIIVAVEPERGNFERLQKNTAGLANVHCVNRGIWTRDACLKIEDAWNFGSWGFVCREVEKEEPGTVKAMGIESLMKQFGRSEIDLLKMDIEGSELEVFSANYESWLPKCKIIVIELHDAYRKGCSKAFFSALVKYDFSVFHRGENMICIRN
jgi:FkbM family methyltransferase